MRSKKLHFQVDPDSEAGVEDVQEAIQEAWVEMRIAGSIANANALENNISPQSLREEPSEYLLVERDAGVGTVDAATVIFLSKAAWDIWTHVVMPHIRRRWGDRAIVIKEKERRAASEQKKVEKKSKQSSKEASKKRNLARKVVSKKGNKR